MNSRRFILAGLLALFFMFTGMLLAGSINQATYVALFSVLVLVWLIDTFKDQVKEVYLGKLVLKLYKKGEQGLAFNKFAMSVAEILIKLHEHTPGTAKNRKEREVMINDLMISIKADKNVREKALENAKLITKLMATEDETELKKIRKEIDTRGLFD